VLLRQHWGGYDIGDRRLDLVLEAGDDVARAVVMAANRVATRYFSLNSL
jgi:hypothetical protein